MTTVPPVSSAAIALFSVITRQGRVRRRGKRRGKLSEGQTIRWFLATVAFLLILLNIFFFGTIQDHAPAASTATAAATDQNIVESGNDAAGDSRTRAIFKEAGVELSPQEFAALPSWSQIEAVVGKEPILYNLPNSCDRFRDAIPGVERNIGCSGMFNSGTNLVTQLLKENCKIPERVAQYGMDGPFHDPQGKAIGPGEAHGIRWQVPWGKHMPANYRDEHATKWATKIWKESVLAIVTIRNPYDWMKSTCKHPYSAKWPHNEREKCPNLVTDDGHAVDLQIKYDQNIDHHKSLAHLYNDWYNRYIQNATFPYVIVRFEDLQFYAKNVTTQICHCAGGTIRSDRPFSYIVDSAKQGPGHGKQESRTGMVEAWVRYGQAMKPQNGFSKADYEAAQDFLDPHILKAFGYKHPPPNKV